MTTAPSTGFSLGLWWKRNRKFILPPIFGIGGFLLFWQLSASLGLTNVAAKQPGGASGPTSISRAAGLALTKMLSKEFAAQNVLVNTVVIGKIKSGQHERTRKKLGLEPDVYFKKVAEDIPMKRMGETDEAADAILFLASSLATYVTGTSINLDGGLSGVL